MAKPKLLYRLLLVLAIALNVVALFPPQSASAQTTPAGCGNVAGPPTAGTICPDGSTPLRDPTLPAGCPAGPAGPPSGDVACPARPGRSACTLNTATQRCMTADGRDVTRGDALAADPSDTAEEQTCSTGTGLAGALAWVLCPLGQLIADATGFVERNLIVPFLTVSPLQTGDSPVYRLWESMRNIANVLFIIAFFVVIFSQATSVGLSNYGIKRILPRLALVAIGTNLSYFIVAFIIDAFNIFGVGISDLVLGAIAGGGGGNGTEANAGNIFTLSTIGVLGVGLAAVITTAGTVLGWLISLIGIAFLIILVAVIVLVVRQMLIILLVIVSPLAFVAWLLPNTEKYFNKWRGMLIQLLMMYPLIVLLFAVGKIVQALIVGYDFDLAAGEGSAEGTAEAVKVFMGFFAAAVPLVFLPFTFVFAGGMLGKMYGALQNRGREYSKKGFEKGKERLEPRLNELRQGLRQRGTKLKDTQGKGFKAWAARRRGGVMRGLGGARVEEREAIRAGRAAEYERARQEWLADMGIGNKKFQEKAAGMGGEAGMTRVAARGQSLVDKAEREAIDNEMTLLNRQLKELNIDQKSFAGGHLRDYFEKGQDELVDKAGNVIRDSKGESFKFSKHPELLRAALNSAASQGEVGTVEAARLGGQLAGTADPSRGVPPRTLDQSMVDQIIRNNDDKLKAKGGYYLATNFNIAAGRTNNNVQIQGTTIDATGKAVQDITSRDVVIQERLASMASSGANSIAGMKAGVLYNTADELQNPAILYQMSTKDREGLFSRMSQIVENPNTLAATEGPDPIRKMTISLGIDRNATAPLSAAEIATVRKAYDGLPPAEQAKITLPPGW